jgi:beta-xylosidase
MIDIGEYVEMAGYFSGTDRRSEFYDSHLLLQGGNGLLSRNGIMKPAGQALKMMNRLGKFKVAASRHFLVTTDRRHNYFITAHNKRRLGYYYYKTPEKSIEKEKLLKYCEDELYLEQNIELTDISNGEYQIRTLKVNEHNGSVMNIWKELGYSETLSEKDIRYIQRVCEPHLQLERVVVKDNRIRLKLTMEPNEISVIEMKWMFT